jgi:cobalt/nickel transport protein
MFRKIVVLSLIGVLCWQTWAAAHFHMLFPIFTTAVTDKAVPFVFQWGHPFEHELFDAAMPERVVMVGPDNKVVDLTRSVTKTTVKGAEQKDVTAFAFSFTPERRGDYTCVATAAPVWMEHEGLFYQDTVKVVLHVQTQKNWDATTGGFELTPLTRPYGLEPGMVFQAQALDADKPQPGLIAEVERLNPVAPKELPPDEQMTRRVKADPNGVLTCTLTDPGWWCITAERANGQREKDGKMYPVKQRTTLWVFVDPKR